MLNALIISKNKKSIRGIRQAIEAAGGQAHDVETVLDGVDSLHEQTIPLVFLEDDPDDGDIAQSVQQIRDASRRHYVQIVAIPDVILTSREDLVAAGFDHILAVPFDPLDVEMLVGSANRSSQAQESLPVEKPFLDATILRQLSLDLAWSTTISQQARHGLGAACKLFRTFRGAIWLRNPEDRTLECVAYAGLSEEYPQTGNAAMSFWSQADWITLSRRPEFAKGPSDLTGTTAELAADENLSSTLAAALFTPSEVIGVLVLFDLPVRDGALSEDQLQLIDTVTATTAMSLDQARLRNDLGNSEATYRQLVEEMPNGVFIHDAQGNFLMSNSALESICGYSGEELALMNLFDLLKGGPEGNDAAMLSNVLEEITAAESDDLEYAEMFGPLTLNLVAADGRQIEAEMYLRPLQLQHRDEELRIQAMARDITTEVRATRELEALRGIAKDLAGSEDQFATLRQVLSRVSGIIDYLHASVWQLDDEGAELLCTAQSGTEYETLTTDPAKGVIGKVLESSVPKHVADAQAHSGVSTVDETVREVVVVPLLADDSPLGVLQIQTGEGRQINYSDISFLESVSAQIAGRFGRKAPAQTVVGASPEDKVTGADSREIFMGTLLSATEKSDGEPVSLLLISVDGLRFFNRTYGHAVGDDLLRQVHDTLRRQLPPEHRLGRIGGDEFCALLPGVEREELVKVAEDLRIGVATQLFMVGDQLEHVTVSVGAATSPDDGEGADRLLVAASDATVMARHAGGNLVFQTNAALGRLAIQYEQLADSLRSLPQQTLAQLVDAMDKRLPERSGHASEVAQLAREIGEHLDMARSDLDQIEMAARIHDIGMLLIPDAQLREPLDLTSQANAERALAPAVAGRLLSNVTIDPAVRAAVVHQYENWDGSGFPGRLDGTSIPLAARILAVADRVAGLAGERDDRPAMTMSSVVERLRGEAGARFDPEVVEALAAIKVESFPEPVEAQSAD